MVFKNELRMRQTLPNSGPLDAAVEKQISEYEQDHDLQSHQAIGVQRYLTRLDQNLDRQKHTSIGIQQDLRRLDQQWELDRQKYISMGNRTYYLPTKAHGLMKGIAGLLFGVVWGAVLSRSMDWASIVPYVGIIAFTCAVCFRAFSDFRKAGRYEEAKEKYRHQRDMLVVKQSML